MPVAARVLVVASEEDYASIGAQLDAHGYASHFAHNADEAADLGRTARADIAIVARTTTPLPRAEDEEPLPVLYITDADARDQTPAGGGLAEYLSPAFSEIELLTRLRGLTRLATMREELNRRAETTRSYGVQCPSATPPPNTITDARVMVIAENDINVADLHATLGRDAALALVPGWQEAVRRLERDSFDAIVAYALDGGREWLDLVHSLRGNARFYNLPILAVAAEGDEIFKADAYAAGVNDVLDAGAEPREIAFQVLNQVRQLCYRLSMQEIYREVRHSVTSDNLTGLFTRGFMKAHLGAQLDAAVAADRPLSLAYMRLDTLAWANGSLGYAAGDQLLRQVGGLIGNLVRAEDLAARHRGDCFVIVMPDTPLADARVVTSRLCGVVNSSTYALPDVELPVDAHLSVACVERVGGDDPDTLLRRARRGLGS